VITVNTVLVKRKTEPTTNQADAQKKPDAVDEAQEVKANTDLRRQIDDDLRAAIGNTIRGIDVGTSGTSIVIPELGSTAFNSYGALVIDIYERYWIKPPDINESYVVKATVVIERSGRVRSANITKRCGQPAVDKSVDELLDRVKTLPAFPEDCKDASRSFNIEFDLKPNRLTG